jgi:hypothetical protein
LPTGSFSASNDEPFFAPIRTSERVIRPAMIPDYLLSRVIRRMHANFIRRTGRQQDQMDIAQILEYLAEPGLIFFFTTCAQPAGFNKCGLNWWYVGPHGC